MRIDIKKRCVALSIMLALTMVSITGCSGNDSDASSISDASEATGIEEETETYEDTENSEVEKTRIEQVSELEDSDERAELALKYFNETKDNIAENPQENAELLRIWCSETMAGQEYTDEEIESIKGALTTGLELSDGSYALIAPVPEENESDFGKIKFVIRIFDDQDRIVYCNYYGCHDFIGAGAGKIGWDVSCDLYDMVYSYENERFDAENQFQRDIIARWDGISDGSFRFSISGGERTDSLGILVKTDEKGRIVSVVQSYRVGIEDNQITNYDCFFIFNEGMQSEQYEYNDNDSVISITNNYYRWNRIEQSGDSEWLASSSKDDEYSFDHDENGYFDWNSYEYSRYLGIEHTPVLDEVLKDQNIRLVVDGSSSPVIGTQHLGVFLPESLEDLSWSYGWDWDYTYTLLLECDALMYSRTIPAYGMYTDSDGNLRYHYVAEITDLGDGLTQYTAYVLNYNMDNDSIEVANTYEPLFYNIPVDYDIEPVIHE